MNSNLSISRREFLLNVAQRTGIALVGSAAVTRRLYAPESVTEPWQLGCYTRPFDKFDWRIAFDSIAEAGFKYAGLISTKSKEWIIIRVDTQLEEVQEMGEEAGKRGLKLISAYADFSVAKSLKDGIVGLKKLIELCVVARCPNLLLGGVSDENLSTAYFKAIAECCDYAAAKGVGLSIKPHGGQNATGPQCRKAIERVAHKNFGLWYDPGNIFYYSDGALDPVNDASAVDGLLVGMSIKDYRHPKDVMITPGSGQVDFRKVFARLQQGGFKRGPMLVECLQPGSLAEITAEAKKVRRFLEELTAA